MVLYFTGTGNSRYLARRIAERLEMPLYDLNACIKAGNPAPVQTGRDVVLVTPTYAWRIPRVVSEWLGKTTLTGAERIWFVMDCGSEIGNAAKYNRQLAAQKQLQYMGTAQIIMPENYIAMFNAPQKEQARSIVEQAEPALQKVLQERPVPLPCRSNGVNPPSPAREHAPLPTAQRGLQRGVFYCSAFPQIFPVLFGSLSSFCADCPFTP